MRAFLLLVASLVALGAAPARANLAIFACEPERAALAREIGGDAVSVLTATTAMQDPHHIEARPSLIARFRRADLAICTGAELEIGWLPLLQRQAGNPHLHLDPRNIARIAPVLVERMATLDPGLATQYRTRGADFLERWNAARLAWEAKAAPLRGHPVAVQHRDWGYLAAWLGLNEVVALEPKPGIPPSAAHLAGVLDRLKQAPVKAVLVAAYQDTRPAQFIGERTGTPVAILPFTVGGSPAAATLFGLFDDTLARLLATLK